MRLDQGLSAANYNLSRIRDDLIPLCRIFDLSFNSSQLKSRHFLLFLVIYNFFVEILNKKVDIFCSQLDSLRH